MNFPMTHHQHREQQRAAFLEKHGTPVKVPDPGGPVGSTRYTAEEHFVFADGARMVNVLAVAGVAGSGADFHLHDPHEHPYERQKVVVRYWAILSTKLRREFAAKHAKLSQYVQGPGGGHRSDAAPPSETVLAQLVDLRDAARDAAKRHTEAKQLLEQLTPQHVRINDQIADELAQQNMDFATKLSAIKL